MHSTASSAIKVLIVENDPVTRELLAQVLRMGRFETNCPSTGEQALLTLISERWTIDWLITAIELPGLVCGRLLAEEYHTHRPQRPVLYLSDLTSEAERRPARSIIVPRHAAPMRVLDLLKTLSASGDADERQRVEEFARVA